MDAREADQADFDREAVARRGLYEFVKRAWHQVETTPYNDNWHIALICERLEACFERQIQKLIINVPPGFSKSLMASMFYHPWVWTIQPAERFLYACFDQDLSNLHSAKARDLIKSSWFQARWPVEMPRETTKGAQYYENGKGGWRFASSVPRGKGTGRHPHQRWIDDPVKPLETQGSAKMTKRALDLCIQWYKGTIATRQAEPATTVDGLIMQRLHDGDLAGALKAEWGDACEHLVLPMHYDPARAYSFSVII